jgi:hypothetical protein
MIDPHQTGWWAGQRLTRLGFADRTLTGAGVSVYVLLHAFAGQDLVWYSALYGDHDDNVQLLAVDRRGADALERLPPHRLTMTEAAVGSPGIEEYALSDEVAARLGVRFDGEYYSVDRHELIRYQIFCHDDCFFAVEAVEEVLLKQLLHVILRQHSFYLGTPVDWSGVLDELCEVLVQRETIRMKSNPHRQSVTVSWEAEPESFLAAILGRRASREMRIDKGKARFTDSRARGGA